MTKHPKFPVLWIIGELLLGCSNEDLSDLQILLQNRSFSATLAPLPIFPVVATFSYPSESRDPFQPAWTVTVTSQPNRQRSRDPLETIPLDSLHLVGSLTLAGKLWGLVKTPDGNVHSVTVGSYLGQHDGRVQQVGEDRLLLTELIPDGVGGWQERPATLVAH